MKEIDFETAKAIHEIGKKTDRAALKIIKKLGLKDKQAISEDELLVVVKVFYPEDYAYKMNILLESKYFKTVYFLDLKAKRDDSELIY
ncbi:MAG: hypothetical protein NWF01_07935 [Candidatus Bathyarchaeota archaeon]|nr:hypothetical protein [Candidatus Bathyarchaeota archaeon]